MFVLILEDDVNTLTAQVKKMANKDYVLFGESRGSSTIINYLGSKLCQKSVKAAVVDSPFDTMQNVLSHRLGRFYLDKIISPATVEKGLPYLLKYKVNGLSPIKSTQSISKEIPLLFICSREDTQVPYTSSIKMYKKLRSKGHSNVHILIVAHGAHGWLMTGKSKETYLHVTHAFYKKYGIGHNPNYAQKGEKIFAGCQPNLGNKEDS